MDEDEEPILIEDIFIGLGEVMVRREATNNTQIASIDSIIIVLPNFVAISCFICHSIS